MDCLPSPTTKRRLPCSISLFPPHRRYTSWRWRSLVSWNSSTMMYRNCRLHFSSTSGCVSSSARAVSSRSSNARRPSFCFCIRMLSCICSKKVSQAGARVRAFRLSGRDTRSFSPCITRSISALFLPVRFSPLPTACRMSRFSCTVISDKALRTCSSLASNQARLPAEQAVTKSGVSTACSIFTSRSASSTAS